MFTYLHACIIKYFCGTHFLHAQVVMHTLTDSKIYCQLCTTTATTTLNITTDNKNSVFGIGVSLRIPQVKVGMAMFYP